jgi:hypothetical protein
MSRTRRRTVHKTTATSTDVATKTRMVTFVDTPMYLEFVQHLGDPATTLSTVDNLLDGLQTMNLGHGDLETTEFPDLEEIAAKYPAPPIPTVQDIEDELFPYIPRHGSLEDTLIILTGYDDDPPASADFVEAVKGWLVDEEAHDAALSTQDTHEMTQQFAPVIVEALEPPEIIEISTQTTVDTEPSTEDQQEIEEPTEHD